LLYYAIRIFVKFEQTNYRGSLSIRTSFFSFSEPLLLLVSLLFGHKITMDLDPMIYITLLNLWILRIYLEKSFEREKEEENQYIRYIVEMSFSFF